VEGSCEHGDKPSDSIECWEILENLCKWRLLKKDSAPWRELVSKLVGQTLRFQRKRQQFI
jgi:hypothetical protein